MEEGWDLSTLLTDHAVVIKLCKVCELLELDCFDMESAIGNNLLVIFKARISFYFKLLSLNISHIVLLLLLVLLHVIYLFFSFSSASFCWFHCLSTAIPIPLSFLPNSLPHVLLSLSRFPIHWFPPPQRSYFLFTWSGFIQLCSCLFFPPLPGLASSFYPVVGM